MVHNVSTNPPSFELRRGIDYELLLIINDNVLYFIGTTSLFDIVGIRHNIKTHTFQLCNQLINVVTKISIYIIYPPRCCQQVSVLFYIVGKLYKRLVSITWLSVVVCVIVSMYTLPQLFAQWCMIIVSKCCYNSNGCIITAENVIIDQLKCSPLYAVANCCNCCTSYNAISRRWCRSW